jgi:hypothetical protein
MIEIVGDLFAQDCDAICITTNSVMRHDGRAVMGAGIAKIARDKYFGLDWVLATSLKRYGNVTSVLLSSCRPAIVSLPTKNHWRDPSDLNLIENSIKSLVKITTERGWNRVCLTPFGCGNGHLNWQKDCRPIGLRYLDDRFTICFPP